MGRRATLAILFAALVGSCLLAALTTSAKVDPAPFIILALLIIPLSIAISNHLESYRS
jgi:hypothetical protein